MELFMVIALCSYQHSTPQDASGCQAIAEAYLKSIDGQKTLDGANKRYIEPLPEELKRAGAVGMAISQQKLDLRLNKYLVLGMSYHHEIGRDEVYNYLTFRREFN